MDFLALCLKYTGQRIDDDAIIAAHRHGGLHKALAHSMEQAAEAVRSVDRELTAVTTQVSACARKVDQSLSATAGEPVPTLNPLGELQAGGPRFDALIAIRAGRIEHLRQLVNLWRLLPAHTSTPDGT